MTIPAYPLSWPTGWHRTPDHGRTRAKFGTKKTSGGSSYRFHTSLTINEAVARVRAELERMSVSEDDMVISSNLALRLDGMPRSGQAEPRDPGVAVYWRRRNELHAPPKCMAIDRYDRVADNLAAIAAIAATLEAMRAIERHGGAAILERAFTGFTAIEAPARVDWQSVLGLKPGASTNDVRDAYRRLRSQHHPDRGGDPDTFQRVQEAYEAYIRDNSTQV